MTIIRDIAKDTLTPLLKELGFKSRGLTWNRRRGEFVDVINVQRAKGSSEIEESMTVNVGIVIPEFLQVILGKTPLFFNEADCIVRARPNDIETGAYDKSLDKWWDITQQNADQRADEIQFFVLNKAVPFLGSFEELSSVARYLDQLQGWQTKYPYIQISRALVLWRLDDIRYKEVLLGPAKAWEEQVANVRRWMQESTVT